MPLNKQKDFRDNQYIHQLNNFYGEDLAFVANKSSPDQEVYDYNLINSERIVGRQRQHTFSKNRDNSNNSHLGYHVFKRFEEKQRYEKQKKSQRQEEISKYQFEEDERIKQSEEVRKLFNVGNAGSNYRLAKELEYKYQMYCRYETGITDKLQGVQKDGMVLQKFMKNKLNQYSFENE